MRSCPARSRPRLRPQSRACSATAVPSGVSKDWMDAHTGELRGDRSTLERSPLSGIGDRLLRWILTALAAAILLLIGFFFVRLYIEAKPAFDRFGVIGF